MGGNVEIMFGDHFSLNYSVLYVPAGDDSYYFYTGGGQAGSVYLLRKAIVTRTDLGLAIPLSLVGFFLPESFGFHVPLGTKSRLGIFISPYGFEFIKNRETDEEDHEISFEMGSKYYYLIGDWLYIIPQVGVKNIYGEEMPTVSFGASVLVKVQ